MQSVLAYQEKSSKPHYRKEELRRLIQAEAARDQSPARPVLARYMVGIAMSLPAVAVFLALAPTSLTHAFWLAVVIGAFATVIANLSTTVYMHRHLAHMTFKIKSPGLLMFFRITIWMTSGMKPRNWAWWHRVHHMFEDEAEDPHSPLHKGLSQVEIYNGDFFSRDQDCSWFAASMPPDLAACEDDYERRWFNNPKLGLFWGIGTGVILYALFGLLLLGWQTTLETIAPAGFVLAFAHVFFYLGLSGAVNSWCHWYGKARFNNYARNSWFIAWLTMGEGNHNAHHGREWFAGLWSSRWERIRDFGYHFLCLFRALGLVSDWRMPRPDQLYLPQLKGVSRWSKKQYQRDQGKQPIAA